MDKTKFTVVGIAPQSIQEALIKLKQHFNLPLGTTEIAKHYILKDIVHFAIKRTFYLKSSIKQQDLVSRINQLSLKSKALISCNETGMFSGSTYGDILYVKINFNQNLIDLHNELTEKLDDLVETKNPEMEKSNYIPHLSMVYNIPKELTQEVDAYVKKNILPLEFELSEILLLKDFDISKDERELIYTQRLS